jgi:hypothetical protein
MKDIFDASEFAGGDAPHPEWCYVFRHTHTLRSRVLSDTYKPFRV